MFYTSSHGLDLCTGSGCIAWSIALEIRDAEVTGVDLSETALSYARQQFGGTPPSSADSLSSSADLIGGSPSFLQADVLDTEQAFEGGPFDLIVSNPPYVLERERAQMRPNVLDWEPALALFVPDEDPLLFYRAIARWSQRFLRPGGVGIVEINEALGSETADIFREAGFKNVQNLPDFYKKVRFVRFEAAADLAVNN